MIVTMMDTVGGNDFRVAGDVGRRADDVDWVTASLILAKLLDFDPFNCDRATGLDVDLPTCRRRRENPSVKQPDDGCAGVKIRQQ